MDSGGAADVSFDTSIAVMLAIAALVMLIGIAVRVARWLRTPAPLRIPLTPAPTTGAGVALRLARETFLFESLLRASPGTWLLGWPFHVALVVVMMQHVRYVTADWWGWVEQVAAWGQIATPVLLVTLVGLWARRLMVDRVRWVSRPADHLMLALLAALALSGAALKYLWPTDVLAVKRFVVGVLSGRVETFPRDALLIAHVAGASLIFALAPFSKLMHGPGVLINPTRAQRDRSRLRSGPRRET